MRRLCNAICADRNHLDDGRYEVVNDNPTEVPSTGGPFAQSTARGPSGTVAYSAGATLDARRHEQRSVCEGPDALQLIPTSGPLDIARATALRGQCGFDESWTLRAYASRAEPEGGVHAEGTLAPGDSVSTRCSGNTYVHGAGGAAEPLTAARCGCGWSICGLV
jgi:hypothetical protein